MTERNDCQVARHTGGWILLGVLFLLACLIFKQPSPSEPILNSSAPIHLGVDINRAGPAELACIPGVGQSLAERIVAYRQTHGPFRSISQLEQVSGVGPAKAAQLAEALLPLRDQAARLAANPASPSSTETK